jgi:hypothetical protein
MRVGIIRDDLGPGIYTQDVESRVQRAFSMEPPGQSRNLRQPTDVELDELLGVYGIISLVGSDTGATKDTSSDDTLRIRAASGAYQVITVTSGAATPVATVVNDLNLGFKNLGLPFVAAVVGTNQVQIDTVAPNNGPDGVLDIDTIGNGSTLSTALGFSDGATLSGVTVSALQTAVYSGPTGIDVSSATIVALGTWADLQAADSTALVDAIADSIAPSFVETGSALLSFAYGTFSKLQDATFQPGGDRSGLPAGAAAGIVQDDGVTAFSL